MAKELPYWKFEPSEWDNGNIQICSRSVKGLFIDICAMYWSRVGELPYALALQKLCNGDANELQVLENNQIIIVKEGQIIIEFLDEQLSEFRDVSEKRSKAAEKRWSNANALQMESKSNAIRQDKKREDKPRKEEKKEEERKLILFDSWWNLYDKKVGRDKVKPKWLTLSMEEMNSCLDVVSNYVKSTPDKQFRKHPTTYLNGKHWNDEIIIKTTQNGNTETKSNDLGAQADRIARGIFGSDTVGNATGSNESTEDINYESADG